MPLLLLVDIGSLLYPLFNVFHPDWLIRLNFRLHRSDNFHKDSHQKSWMYPRVKRSNDGHRVVDYEMGPIKFKLCLLDKLFNKDRITI